MPNTPRAPRSRQPQQRARNQKKKMFVLGKGCGHLASASELNLGQFGARGGVSRGRVLPIPQYDPKRRGCTPL